MLVFSADRFLQSASCLQGYLVNSSEVQTLCSDARKCLERQFDTPNNKDSGHGLYFKLKRVLVYIQVHVLEHEDSRNRVVRAIR